MPGIYSLGFLKESFYRGIILQQPSWVPLYRLNELVLKNNKIPIYIQSILFQSKFYLQVINEAGFLKMPLQNKIFRNLP